MQKSTFGRVGDYTIRGAETTDIPSVIGVNAATLPEHYSDYFYYEVLNEFPGTFIVAELGGEVVGYVMCRTEYGLSVIKRFGIARKGHIISIATMEAHRGKGIGTELIRHSIEEMKRAGCKEVFLEVRVTNDGAVRLYRKLGFAVTGTMNGYYKDGEAAYLMAQTV
ncbi:MAG: GNAT family N-acetyltransferase [Nitrososphaerota archaeon]|nr:GNAT family N-acetyltransferase [Nitrososphaerota archaeon]MDG6967249.1 GNAT family N-acetyltransferase [Nitrososphaerota archaeon]MDG6977894.1 GNAT family N-acetyltransferase [Nitrososphaerota archaeon]MDG7005848.1 GNAT family N-acetyltransferase [Nitrososphaerota archaeon]MDG7021595.1 GNAT family N-acetyltransferase [Nitrososphaerota archaeon]